MVNYICKAGSWESWDVEAKWEEKEWDVSYMLSGFSGSVFGWTGQYYHTLSYYLLHDTKAQIQAICLLLQSLLCNTLSEEELLLICGSILKDLVNSLDLICWALLHVWCVYLPIVDLYQQLCQDLLCTCAF